MTKQRKIDLLKGMDKYLRNNVQDEEIFCDEWLTMGVPNCASEDDYEGIAEDDELFDDCLLAFAKCIVYDNM
jgi:hypothetical protein